MFTKDLLVALTVPSAQPIMDSEGQPVLGENDQPLYEAPTLVLLRPVVNFNLAALQASFLNEYPDPESDLQDGFINWLISHRFAMRVDHQAETLDRLEALDQE